MKKKIEKVLDSVKEKLFSTIKDMDDLQRATKHLQAKLKMAKLRYQGLQLVANFASWQIGETRDLNGTLNTLVEKRPDAYIFNTIIPPNTGFPPHFHEKDEFVQVISGTMKDHLVKGVWGAGSSLIYKEMKAHAPYNDTSKNVQLLVTFKR